MPRSWLILGCAESGWATHARATRRWALIASRMAPPLIVLIAASPTYPPKAAAVAALPPGRMTNSEITAVIVTTNVKPTMACNAGPRNGLPARMLSASQAPARKSRSISAMRNQYPPQAERVPPPLAFRYQGRHMATGSRTVPAPARTPAGMLRLDRAGLATGGPALGAGGPAPGICVARSVVCIGVAPFWTLLLV